MTIDPDTILSHGGMLLGGVLGGAAAGWAWFKRFAGGAADSRAAQELHAFERKAAEYHRQFDERLRLVEAETARQKGILEQTDKRFEEILQILRGRKV